MKTRWIGKNIDLNLLCEYVESFFRKRGFKVRREKPPKKMKILATLKQEDFPLNLFVEVDGKPQDFIVEIDVASKTKSLRMFRPFLTMFGLGVFFIHRLKSLDFYERLEEEFWSFMDEVVSNLAVGK